MNIVKLCPTPSAPDFDALCEKLKLDEDFQDEFRDIYDEGLKIAAPKMIYGKCPVTRLDDGESVLVGDMQFKSRVLHTNMKNIQWAYPYVATCGRELYEFSMAQGDPLSQFWVDTISEAMLGQALTEGTKAAQEREHTETLYAMNPGSLPNWPISQQRPLFALLGDVMGEIGVELTESFLMLPVKSVSGLLFEAAEHYTNCTLCPRDGCPNRRDPFDAVLYMEKYNLGEI